MVIIRKTNDIILSLIDFYRAAQPQLDTKPGTVARDLLIDGPSSQLARLYEELARIRSAGSLRLALGIDLDRLGQNVGAVRKQGSRSSGPALFTFNELDADIPINRGDIISANNGATFTVTNGVTVSPIFANTFRATASKFRADLDFVGITDEFAVEVSAEATATGTLGNISKYSLITSTTPGVSNVTNAVSFGGGSNPEDDAAFRSRILAVFSGANTGTALGYRNAVLQDAAVLDAIVIEPGDVLMTRDGTQVFEDEDGTKTIISEGTGGKVDVIVFGTRLLEILDSFIFRDQSNKGDPTDPSNDFVLGQIEGDEDKTVTTRRIENLANGVLPDQPVNDIVEVSGSSSGANFVEKQTDSLGRVTGNFELIRDTGSFAGSPFGFDRLHFISDRISDFSEDQTKGKFNGQDTLTFSDVLQVGKITQEISVVNENSSINASDRRSIQLAHAPISAVTRVFNITTGERYVVADQNPDGDGTVNETGRILISGNTLPAVSDSLQVDYTWIFDYDQNFDYDNRLTNRNPRSVLDSVDWGFSNAVRREESTIDFSGSLFTASVTHQISSVINVNTFTSETSFVSLVQNRLAVIVNSTVENVISVVRTPDGAELFDTNNDDGSISGLTIFLPTDTIANFGDAVSVVYNANDVFTVDDVSGSFNDNLITLPTQTGLVAGTIVEVNYIANVRTLLPTTVLSALPAIRNGNAFNTVTSASVGVQPTTHVFSSPGVIAQNLRQAPSRLRLTIAGSISAGVITVAGTAFTAVQKGVFTVSTAGLQHDLSSLIKSALGLSSSASVPSTVEVIRVISVEKVTASGVEVLSSDFEFDIKGYQIRNNNFVKDEAIASSNVSSTEFVLPDTEENIDNAPNVGDSLRITFFIATNSDTENVSFSQAGALFTDKIFAIIDTISISSGFTSGSSQSASLTVASANQPAAGTRYTVAYDYLAPKSNERITIRYNQNRLIADSTLLVEDVRPISADVLLKSHTPILVDATLNVVVESGFKNSSTIVQQNVQDVIVSALNADRLGTIIDASDLVQVAYTVSGVDRARVLFFNKTGETGSVLSIEAEKNEVIQANNVIVEIETR